MSISTLLEKQSLIRLMDVRGIQRGIKIVPGALHRRHLYGIQPLHGYFILQGMSTSSNAE